MNRSTRWSVAFGAGILLSLGLLSPVATATASPASSTASLDRSVEIPARSLFDRAVTPSECSATLLDEFFFSELAAMTDEEFNFLVAHQDVFFGVPTYDPLYFGTADDPDYALTLHARQLQNTFRDVKKFWSGVQSDDIQLMAMHGRRVARRGPDRGHVAAHAGQWCTFAAAGHRDSGPAPGGGGDGRDVLAGEPG